MKNLGSQINFINQISIIIYFYNAKSHLFLSLLETILNHTNKFYTHLYSDLYNI